MEKWMNPALPFSVRALALVSAMTPEEKVGQLNFDAPAIPRLGVRAWTWWNEASHGVIPVFSRFDEASSFPVMLALANSWDPALVKKVGTAISDEMRALYNLTGKELDYWCPTVNMGRDPRWGRNDEAFGEDPILAGSLAAAYVQGIQGEDEHYWKAVSTPKHFAANNSEYNRNSFSSNMDEATLREYYLPVFERCFKEGGAHSVMTAYNRIAGVPCSVNKHLLQDILRDEWGFDGYVVSDDGAVGDIGPNYNLMWGQPRGHFYTKTMQEGAALALEAGTDICCGNDYRVWMQTALDEGYTNLDAVDRALVHAFTARFALGEFDKPEDLPWFTLGKDTICCQKHADIAVEAAEASLTLLRNENALLPLKAEKTKNILVVGPNAIYRQLGSYSIGGFADTRVSVPPLKGIQALADELGFSVTYRKGWNILGKSIDQTENRFTVLARAAEENGMDYDAYIDARWPDAVRAINKAREERLKNNSNMAKAPVIRHPVNDTELNQSDAELWTAALEAAKEADAVIVIAGTDPGVTSEGRDRATLAMPYQQDEKIQELTAVNPNTAAVLITSGPVTGDFLTKTPAVLWAAYGGESQGTAIARALFGVISPSGKSCETWYASDADLPDIADYGVKILDTPNQMGRTYAYYLGEPLFPFGHGLSYTTFKYADFALRKSALTPDDTLEVSVTVENTGDMAAAETVQLYAKRTALWQNLPLRKLIAFTKVTLKPGEAKRVTLSVPVSIFKRWDLPSASYYVPEGEYIFWLGASAGKDAEICSAKATVSGKWNAPLANVTLRCGKRILKAGETAKLDITAVKEDAVRISADGAEISSSDESVIKVENGEAVAVGAGYALVTLRYSLDGVTKTSSIPLCVE